MTIGPQPSTFAQPKEDDINRFLDRQPPKSLVYICFGSYTWIPNLRQTKILFDTIDKLGLGVLVINSLMTLFSSPRTDLLKLINERLERLGEKGMLVDWATQEVVLRQQGSHHSDHHSS